MTTESAPKRRVIVDYDVDFVSGVDDPAQERATARLIKSKTETPMPTAAKTAEQLESEITETMQENKRLRQELALTDGERAFASTLSSEERTEFCAKSKADRGAQIEAAASADPVVYTGKTGRSKDRKFRRSEQAAADLAADYDELAQRELVTREKARKSRIDSRVAGLAFSDDQGNLTALVTAVEDMPDEADRAKANKALDAINAIAKKSRGPSGSDATAVTEGDATYQAAEAKYEATVEAFATKKKVSIEVARVRAPQEDKAAIAAYNVLSKLERARAADAGANDDE